MLKYILPAVVILLIPGSRLLAAEEQCPDPGSTMVWRVEAEPPLSIHLMGSVHVGRPQLYPLAPVVEDLYQRADHLVFEVDPDQVNNPAAVLEIQRRGMLPAGETLSDHLSAETLVMLDDVLERTGLPRALVMRWQPWLVINVLSVLQVANMGLMPQLGTENYLLLSKSPETDVQELESLEAQLGYLASMNDEIYLRETLLSFNEEGEAMLNDLLAAWACADHEQLHRIMSLEYDTEAMNQATSAAMARLEEMLLYSRNIRMADRVASYLEEGEGSYFIVVGAAHLLGEGSIIALLREAGYEVHEVRQQ